MENKTKNKPVYQSPALIIKQGKLKYMLNQFVGDYLRLLDKRQRVTTTEEYLRAKKQLDTLLDKYSGKIHKLFGLNPGESIYEVNLGSAIEDQLPEAKPIEYKRAKRYKKP